MMISNTHRFLAAKPLLQPFQLMKFKRVVFVWGENFKSSLLSHTKQTSRFRKNRLQSDYLVIGANFELRNAWRKSAFQISRHLYFTYFTIYLRLQANYLRQIFHNKLNFHCIVNATENRFYSHSFVLWHSFTFPALFSFNYWSTCCRNFHCTDNVYHKWEVSSKQIRKVNLQGGSPRLLMNDSGFTRSIFETIRHFLSRPSSTRTDLYLLRF